MEEPLGEASWAVSWGQNPLEAVAPRSHPLGSDQLAGPSFLEHVALTSARSVKATVVCKLQQKLLPGPQGINGSRYFSVDAPSIQKSRSVPLGWFLL